MTVLTPEPSDDGAKILQEASDVIESEQANIRIEIEFAKAIRVGTMLIHWRRLMVDGGFTDEWVESAAADIFHKFFPPPIEEHHIYEANDDDD